MPFVRPCLGAVCLSHTYKHHIGLLEATDEAILGGGEDAAFSLCSFAFVSCRRGVPISQMKCCRTIAGLRLASQRHHAAAPPCQLPSRECCPY